MQTRAGVLGWRLGLSLLFLCAVACSQEDRPGLDVVDDLPALADPVWEQNGVTGGQFATQDGAFEVLVPDGAIPAALGADPYVVRTDGSALEDALVGDETLVSDVFEVDLGSELDFVTTQTVTLRLTFDPTRVPEPERNALHVFARVIHPDRADALVLTGHVDGDALVLSFKGLLSRASFGVVYSPEGLITVAADASGTPKRATQVPPWQTNQWVALFRQTDKLRGIAAGILGIDKGDLTTTQLMAVVQTRLVDHAAAAGGEYEAAGFRQPNLMVLNEPLLSGNDRPFYPIGLVDEPSGYEAGLPDENDELHGYAFGRMFISIDRLDDDRSGTLGSARASAAHEMFHSIQFGYDIGFGQTMIGFLEGTATTYGVTIDSELAEPQVRLADPTEEYRLSIYLLAPNTRTASYAYANQDFYAWLGRVYHFNHLDYVQELLEALRTAVDLLVAGGSTGARMGPPWKTVLQAHDQAFLASFGQGLGAAYYRFVKERAVTHPVASQLRATDPDQPGLRENLFGAKAIEKVSLDPEDAQESGVEVTFDKVARLSARAVEIKPSRAVEDGVDLFLSVNTNAGVLGVDVRAALYRAGQEFDLSGPFAVTGWGASTEDVLTVLLVNTSLEHNYLALGIRLADDTPPDSFQATIEIDGSGVPFSAHLITGALGTYSGAIERTGLPSVYATEATTWTDISQTTVIILTDPTRIDLDQSSSYGFLEEPDVFEQGLGGASAVFFSPRIVNQDDKQPVGFTPTGGQITFSQYGASIGDRLTATFQIQIAGEQVTDDLGQQTRELTGTITGSLDVQLRSEP